jgi:rubrerythrin
MLYNETNETSFTSRYKDSGTVYGDNIISNCKNVVNLIDKDQIKKNVNHQRHFILCESCFWCATYLIGMIETVYKCPICNSPRVKSLLIR